MTAPTSVSSKIWDTTWWEDPEREGMLLLPGPSRLPDLEKDRLARYAEIVERDQIEIPPFPIEAMEVMREIRKAEPDIEEITAKLERGPVLSAQLLRTANSVRYGARTTIDTLRGAVMFLGLGRVQESCMRAMLSEVTNSLRSKGWAEREWQFAVSSAAIARAIARRVRLDDEQVYMAALLHDIGRICLIAEMEGRRDLPPVPGHKATEIILECLHRAVGDRVAEKWELPPSVRDAIKNHMTGRMEDDESTAQFPATAAVEVAGDLCIAMGLGREPVKFGLDTLSAVEELKLTGETLDTLLREDLPEALEEAWLE